MEHVVARIWDDLLGRADGPLTFRLILQPAMAIAFAIRDGLKDARAGRSPYLWTVCSDATERRSLIKDGWRAVAKIFVMALVIDAIYQFIVRRWFYPGEALIVAFVLAMVPYALARGPVNRIARLWLPVVPAGRAR
jgi:hypothetical protein